MIAVVFLVALTACDVRAASLGITAPRDSYENIPVGLGDDFNDIQENLVEEEYESIPGLYPPKESSKDYYNVQFDELPRPQEDQPVEPNKYVIDVANKVLRLKSDDVTSQETKLSANEEEEIKKLSAAFIELFANSKLENIDWDTQTQTETQTQTPASSDETSSESEDNWKNLNPVITLSKTGISIAFVNITNENSTNATPDYAIETESVEETTAKLEESRDSIWGFLAESVDKMLNEELERRGNISEALEETDTTDIPVYITTEEIPVGDEGKEEPQMINRFVDSLWSLMKTSVEYVGALFGSLAHNEKAQATTTPNASVTSETTSTSTEEQSKTSPSSTTTLFAYEEPSRYHRFPSEEFEKRGRDIDSILYGHGIA